MSQGNGIVDSEVAAMLLGVTKDNLRQMVRRKKLVPIGRQMRRSTFHLADVLALQHAKEFRLGKRNNPSP